MKHIARKRFGQHFLTDTALIDDIVRAIDPHPGQPLVELDGMGNRRCVGYPAGDEAEFPGSRLDFSGADHGAWVVVRGAIQRPSPVITRAPR